MDSGLKDKVAWVCGVGKGDGLGAVIARSLAAEGVHLLLADYEPEPGESGLPGGGASGLRSVGMAARGLGVDVVEMTVDLSDPEEVEALGAKGRARFGRADILVTLPGGSWGGSRVGEYDVDAWRLTMETNLYSIFLAARQVLPLMEEQGGGVVVNVASMAARRSVPEASALGAAQAGVVQFTRDVATEYGAAGVRAHVLLPGELGGGGDDATYRAMAALLEMSAEEVSALAVAGAPLQRAVSAEDVARLVVFLASDAAAGLTGLCLPVAGGRELPFKLP